MGKRKVSFQGRDLEGVDVGFGIVADGSVTIEAEDGARLRVRPIVLNVVRTDEKTPDGQRLYVVELATNVVLDREPKGDTQ
ncbi:MAG: hypothetical protein HY744_13005 [Deltaproteobacteria bacterium]|nr:hypothetical protein [Deltaproteobacteria bacterium]